MRCALVILLTTLLLAAGCGHDGPTSPRTTPRTYRMGFSATPPRLTLADVLQTIQLWTPRSDAALMFSEPPWDSILSGLPMDSIVIRNSLELAQYYRGLGLTIVACVDPSNGIDRSTDSGQLLAAGRSITEPAIQALFRDYVVALDTLIHPEYLGLASETNLIRALAPPALYGAVAQTAADAATAVRAHDATVRFLSTVQVETAWGLLPAAGGFQGVAQDLADFSFAQTLGLSSYPYFAWADPDDVPLDYYSRVAGSSPLPVMVIEGGWTSVSLSTIVSTPEMQARYIRRQASLLDRVNAAAWFQITFTDLDLTGVALPPGSILPLFAHLGLVDSAYVAKPALAEWDRVFARPRR